MRTLADDDDDDDTKQRQRKNTMTFRTKNVVVNDHPLIIRTEMLCLISPHTAIPLNLHFHSFLDFLYNPGWCKMLMSILPSKIPHFIQTKLSEQKKNAPIFISNGHTKKHQHQPLFIITTTQVTNTPIYLCRLALMYIIFLVINHLTW